VLAVRPEGGGGHDINIAAARSQVWLEVSFHKYIKRVGKTNLYYINIMLAVAVSIKAT